MPRYQNWGSLPPLTALKRLRHPVPCKRTGPPKLAPTHPTASLSHRMGEGRGEGMSGTSLPLSQPKRRIGMSDTLAPRETSRGWRTGTPRFLAPTHINHWSLAIGHFARLSPPVFRVHAVCLRSVKKHNFAKQTQIYAPQNCTLPASCFLRL